MASYQSFAQVYDILTGNIDYAARAAYFADLLQELAPQAVTVVDLACGTGSLTFALHTLGYQMIGIDQSPDMLMQAMQKKQEEDILFLQQPMEQMTLHRPVDGIVCALDSINHLPSLVQVDATFSRVATYLQPGGIFLFDVNTQYKHQQILADNVFVYDLPEVYCVWQNEYQPDTHQVEITLDFFQPLSLEGTQYERWQENFSEQYYSEKQLTACLEKHQLSLLAVYHEDSRQSPKQDSQRLIYVARKR